jgi:hypothetical protein
VTAFDALLIVDSINILGPHSLEVPPLPELGPPPFLDPSGDDFVSAIDALLVIENINASLTAPVPEPASIILALSFALLVCCRRMHRGPSKVRG